MRWSSDAPARSMKEAYCIGRVLRGRRDWWTRGRSYTSAPGTLLLLQPGDVHRDVALDGVTTIQVVAFAADSFGARAKTLRPKPQLEPGDPEAAPFVRLHDAVAAGADRFTLEVAVAEAKSALCTCTATAQRLAYPVERALELLRARLAEAVSLDDLAAHSGIDKFRLCRAFRAQVGLPPHAYLTRLRIARAKQLLAQGAKPRDVAPMVGLYDQSQLNRHFRRLVGITPGQYASLR